MCWLPKNKGRGEDGALLRGRRGGRRRAVVLRGEGGRGGGEREGEREGAERSHSFSSGGSTSVETKKNVARLTSAADEGRPSRPTTANAKTNSVAKRSSIPRP